MNCQRCELHTTCQNPCIMGEGNPNADLVLVGEAPGFNEDRLGKPFVGEAGKLLNFILNKLGVERSSIYLTNIIKCRPPKNELPKGEELEKISDACWPHLEQELQAIDPKVVVLLGGNPLLLLTGNRFISKHEGMEVETIYEGARTFACYHPAFVLRSPGKECHVARVLAKACKVAGVKIKPKGLEAGLFEYEVRS